MIVGGLAGRAAAAAAARPKVGRRERRLPAVALLRDGPKARDDIARALGLSATRAGQLLDALGARVTSETDPDNPRRKRWRLAEAPAAS